MLLSAEHLSINFGSRQLLSDVNFYLNEGDKVGIIGINGTGKSTFLKVLAGAIEPDSGRISRNPNVQVSFLSQNPVMEDDATVLEQVFLHFPQEFRELNEYEAKSMLTKLGFTDLSREIKIEVTLFSCSGEGNGNPLQDSCLGNPMDRGAWRAQSDMT